jgi:hypothetical protein
MSRRWRRRVLQSAPRVSQGCRRSALRSRVDLGLLELARCGETVDERDPNQHVALLGEAEVMGTAPDQLLTPLTSGSRSAKGAKKSRKSKESRPAPLFEAAMSALRESDAAVFSQRIEAGERGVGARPSGLDRGREVGAE